MKINLPSLFTRWCKDEANGLNWRKQETNALEWQYLIYIHKEQSAVIVLVRYKSDHEWCGYLTDGGSMLLKWKSFPSLSAAKKTSVKETKDYLKGNLCKINLAAFNSLGKGDIGKPF